jgi:hypothetical protein
MQVSSGVACGPKAGRRVRAGQQEFGTLPTRMTLLRQPPIQLFVVAVMVAVGLGFVGWSLMRWSIEDTDAYLAAAQRLASGAELYPQALASDPPLAYRGAPWFIAMWIPLTAVPRPVVNVAWTAVLFIASAWAIWPLLAERRAAGIGLAALCGGLLVWTASRGNVHPLVIAALVHGVGHRSGPLWIALAASLKAVPILFVVAYAAQRQWAKVMLTLILTGLLVLPMPLLGWDPSRTPAGVSLSVYYQIGPMAWLLTAAAAVAIGVAVAFLRPRYAWASMGAASIVALPRLIFYDFSYVLVGTKPPPAKN